jgi:hypothetical protein
LFPFVVRAKFVTGRWGHIYRNWVLHISKVKLCLYLKKSTGVQLQFVLILAADGSASAILPELTNMRKVVSPKSLFRRRHQTDETVHISGIDPHPYSM